MKHRITHTKADQLIVFLFVKARTFGTEIFIARDVVGAIEMCCYWHIYSFIRPEKSA